MSQVDNEAHVECGVFVVAGGEWFEVIPCVDEDEAGDGDPGAGLAEQR